MTDPEPKEEPKKPEGNLPDEVTKVLEDIKAKIDQIPKEESKPPAPTVPSWNEQRAAMQKRLGYNDDQMAAHEEMILKSQAPIVENIAWQSLEKKPDLETYKKEIQEELDGYRHELRTPSLIEKIYFYVKGKHADSHPAVKPAPKEPGVESTRVRSGPGYSGAEPDLGGGERNPTEDEKLSENEAFVAAKLGVSEKDYARSRAVGREAWKMKPADTREFKTSADLELKRMLSRKI